MNIIEKTVENTKQHSFQTPQRSNSTLPRITSFLIKVTARCNLNCDYCYVFNHADQSWKQMPTILSAENRKLLAERIAEYAQQEDLGECLILFHGGEPLLVGVERLVEIKRLIQQAMPSRTKVYFSLQTNGTLLTKERLEVLEAEEIGVSLSLDGPKKLNDLHRLSPKGNSTFDKVFSAFKLLKKYPKTFTGVLGVVDPRVSPREVLSFFSEMNPPRLDFLLPDANYITPPFLRDKNPDIYIDWLLEAFDIWYDEYPELNIRMFEGLMGVIVGLPSQTDAFGLGDVSLLSVETDGFYHDLDVLKITEEGFSSLDLHLKDFSVRDAASSDKIARHRKLLSFEGLSNKCQVCPEVQICGGGAVPHRYGKNGFSNPTVYCREMLALISHARKRLIETISNDNQKKLVEISPGFENINVLNYEKSQFENLDLKRILTSWQDRCLEKFLNVLEYVKKKNPELKGTVDSFNDIASAVLKKLATRPATLLWIKVLEQYKNKKKYYDIEGKSIAPDFEYVKYIYTCQSHEGLEIHHEDYWLRCPFGGSIIFESSASAQQGVKLVHQAMAIIKELDAALEAEIRLLSPYIQFIRDPSAHPDKVVSFSDDVVPGVLYVSISKREGYIDPYDLADSIIHEHRHQKLYLLEQFVPVVLSDTPLISSPWREELRPVSGVYHGAFVFGQLEKYWSLVEKNTSGSLKKKAQKNKKFSQKSLAESIKTLKNSSITLAGRKILEEFEKHNKKD